ncbi:MAG: hypothetical protein JHC96_11135 [Brevundimonas sp.]|uniref:hypothetical protein n=1 Tax=Brevundimonas sp. TaxID=1871086 RepID=UPI001A2EEF3C|nr:hypothetical protein [Brevundimonas sp.]MBJ7319342.1 hypothetical protein [Brevundimonas sp.]
MTTMHALAGPWTGLGALGQPRRLPLSPERVRAALDRLGDLHDEFRVRIDMLMRAADRCNDLRSALIDQLDALEDEEAECEPAGDDEPSLTPLPRWDQTAFGVGDPMSDDEPSLGAAEGRLNQTVWGELSGIPAGMRWFDAEDLEQQEDGGGEDEDREQDWRSAPAAIYVDVHCQTAVRFGAAILPA